MKINKNKVILASLVGFCFWISVERVHDFYINTFPLGKPGNCYSIKYPELKERFQMKILDNNSEEKMSYVSISLFRDTRSQWLDRYTYLQLRMIDPKRVECK